MKDPSVNAAAEGDGASPPDGVPSADKTYDLLPYPTYAFRQTHPDRLATIATYYGMLPVPPERCRVLELGCAGGGNLIPMAEQFPESEFVGIDLSVRQIETGCERVARLGLKNLQLVARNLLDAQLDGQKFDYVICHGVYSWIPEQAREAVLQICADHLSPQGVAYISYNTYPGWRARGIMSDILLHHTSRVLAGAAQPISAKAADDPRDPEQCARDARNLLEKLQRAWAGSRDPKLAYLRHEAEHILDGEDAYLFHAYLGDVNQPFYFREFVSDAARHGLQYLADAHPRGILGADLNSAGRAALREICGDDILEREQYIDFLHCETFRRSLICRGDVEIQRAFDMRPFDRLLMASNAKPIGKVDLAAGAMASFRTDPDDEPIATDLPLLKAALLHLSSIWPDRCAFGRLLDEAIQRVGEPVSDRAAAARWLAQGVLFAYGKNALDLFSRKADCVYAVSEKPVARRLARAESRAFRRAINFQNESVRFDALEIRLIELLDGTRDRTALRRDLLEAIQRDQLSFEQDDEPLADDDLGGYVARQIEEGLSRFARRGLLIA